MKQAAAKPTTTKGTPDELKIGSQFGMALFDIGWRLLAVVLGFILGGRWLDSRLHTYPLFVLLGLVCVIVSFVLIVRQFLKTLPRSQGGMKDD